MVHPVVAPPSPLLRSHTRALPSNGTSVHATLMSCAKGLDVGPNHNTPRSGAFCWLGCIHIGFWLSLRTFTTSRGTTAPTQDCKLGRLRPSCTDFRSKHTAIETCTAEKNTLSNQTMPSQHSCNPLSAIEPMSFLSSLTCFLKSSACICSLKKYWDSSL